jgi:nitroimidazol reductase NimA-like FMN-containing flavoprotein (pyridoxamine 5'-phosphate oxidase superfamily)
MDMEQRQVRDTLNDPLAQELLSSPIPARLAYTGRDGFPRVIPIGFFWNGTQFIMATSPNAPKVRALRARPQVALTIDTNTFPPNVLMVRGTAGIEIVEGVPVEYLEASKKQISPDKWQAFEAAVRQQYPQMAKISISPEWAKVFDFVTRAPSVAQ